MSQVQRTIELAMQHHQAGRLVEAQDLYQKVLAQQPDNPQALHLLGLVLFQSNQAPKAIELMGRAIAINPNVAAWQRNMAKVLAATDQVDQAISSMRRSLALEPNIPDSLNFLGELLLRAHQVDEAIRACRQAVLIQPDFAQGYNNLGTALQSAQQWDQAIQAYRQALELRPDFAEALINLGNALRRVGQVDEAIGRLFRAIELRQDLPEAFNNLGNALQDAGRIDEAIIHYRRALEIRPDWAMAHYNLGAALLLKGDFLPGWRECEWRLKIRDMAGLSARLRQPRWNGEPLNGRRILLYSEQGLGDTIQFIRYVPMVAARGGKIVLICQRDLVSLIKRMDGIESLLAEDQPAPDCDVHCPLLSLPEAFATTLDTVPAAVPYLGTDPELSSRWRERLSGYGGRPKVGLVWAGQRAHENDRNRSISLDAFAPLMKIEGVDFFSLQKGGAALAIQKAPADLRVVDWTNELVDFADTAALVENLDLLITVDTSVAHLGGALARPVWLLLPFVPDWRWMIRRHDSPWYPTMRLFRQPQRGDWETPLSQIAQSLRERI